MVMIRGNIVHGNGLAGEQYGIPTANISLSTPPGIEYGTYAGIAQMRDTSFKAMMYYGPNNPTTLEVHLFDFTGDCYGEMLSVEPQHKISDYLPWTGEDAMKQKIANDVALARAYFTPPLPQGR